MWASVIGSPACVWRTVPAEPGCPSWRFRVWMPWTSTSSFRPRRNQHAHHLVTSSSRWPSRPSRPPSALAPSAGSVAPQERTGRHLRAPRPTTASRQAKKDYVKLDLLALNDFHGNLEPPTGSSGNIPGITNDGTKAGGAAYLASAAQEGAQEVARRGRHAADRRGRRPHRRQPAALGGLPRRADHQGDEHDGPRRRRRWATTSSTRASTSCCACRRAAAWPTATAPTARTPARAARPSRAPTSPTSAPTCSGRTRRATARPTPFKPYKIFKVDGQKVGFIGMTLEDTDTDRRPGRHRRRRLPRRGRDRQRAGAQAAQEGRQVDHRAAARGRRADRRHVVQRLHRRERRRAGHRPEPRPRRSTRSSAATPTRPTTAWSRTRRATRGCSPAPRRSAGW